MVNANLSLRTGGESKFKGSLSDELFIVFSFSCELKRSLNLIFAAIISLISLLLLEFTVLSVTKR